MILLTNKIVGGKQIYTKLILTFVFFALFTITYLFLMGTIELQAHFLPNGFGLGPRPMWAPPCRGDGGGPLRVYMYELPRRFNVGMLSQHLKNESESESVGPGLVMSGGERLPGWPTRSGLRKQHSVEYWMMASLLYDNEQEGSNVILESVRVMDPNTADVFFVPFFSSLSFNTYGHHMTDPETEFDRLLQVDVLKFLHESKYWQRSQGRDHVIPLHHPNSFRFLREQINASILIVADFGRYPKTMSNLRKDVVAPYVHIVDSYTNDEDPDPFESRSTLLFFRGRTVRKDEGVVRAKLENILAGYDDVHYESSFASEESIKLSTKGMRSSKFCLHPAGDTPSSCRLFDAIVSHCVPVIVSDQIELPFEDELDYSKFSIFFSTQEAVKPGYLVDQLRKVSKERWIKMWNILKNISHHYEYQYPPKTGDAVNMIWKQVRNKLPDAKLDTHRSRRLRIPDWWGNRR